MEEQAILASRIALPADPILHFVRFQSAEALLENAGVMQSSGNFEFARISILRQHRNDVRELSKRLLPSLEIEGEHTILYVFALSAQSDSAIAQKTMSELCFPGLKASNVHSFQVATLFPCSGCSSFSPCDSCAATRPEVYLENINPDSIISSKFDARYAHDIFLKAIRNVIIDHICNVSPAGVSRPRKCHDAFLWRSMDSNNIWSREWREDLPLSKCTLQLHLSRTHVIINEVIEQSFFYEMTDHLEPGTPIVILPSCIPGYFQGWYAGQTELLLSEYTDALTGMGAGDWMASVDRNGPPKFIVVWVAVQNIQGDEKGISMIWPSHLCVVPAAPYAHQPLAVLPPLPEALPISQSSIPGSAIGHVELLSANEGSINYYANLLVLTRPELNAVSPMTCWTHALNTSDISLAHFEVDSLAQEANGFVESMAKAREQERESIRKAKESSKFQEEISTPSAGSFTSQRMSIDAKSVQDTLSVSSVIPDTQGQSSCQIPCSIERNLQQTQELQKSSLPASPSFNSAGTKSVLKNSRINLTSNKRRMVPTLPAPDIEMEDRFPFTDDDFDFFDKPKETKTTALLLDESHINNGSIPLPLSEGERNFSSNKVDGVEKPTPIPIVIKRSSVEIGQHEQPPSLENQLPEIKELGQSLKADNVYFRPIPFSTGLRAADNKYQIGKFSLPSPPSDDDCFLTRHNDSSLISSKHRSKKPLPMLDQYGLFTDPRIGVVEKLIGLKRKSLKPHPLAGNMKRPIWSKISVDLARHVELTTSEDSDAESDEEMSFTPPLSAGSADSPSHVMVGLTALRCLFRHATLLPMCTLLRPPGATLAQNSDVTTDAAIAALSVPTPVSPAAIPEQLKSLGDFARASTQESLENPIWAYWCQHLQQNTSLQLVTEVRPRYKEIQTIHQIFRDISSLQAPIPVSQMVELEDDIAKPRKINAVSSLGEVLHTPMMSVRKGAVNIQLLSSALPFWDKLALGPRGGHKDLNAFVLFENDHITSTQAENWMTDVANTYTTLRLGRHELGENGISPLVPVRFEAFRKSIVHLISALAACTSTVILYIIMPAACLTESSNTLRQVLLTLRRASRARVLGPLVSHLIPEYLVLSHAPNSLTSQALSEQTCRSVYDRISQSVNRCMSRRLFEFGVPLQKRFNDFFVTIARTMPAKTCFVYDTPILSLDVVDRHTMLHIGYRFSTSGKWLLVMCVDERGETQHHEIWAVQPDQLLSQTVEQIWTFAMGIAKGAHVEWRFVFAKLGFMSPTELDAWKSMLATMTLASTHEVMISVFLLCVDVTSPWTFLKPFDPIALDSNISQSETNIILSTSSATVAIFTPPVMSVYPRQANCTPLSRFISADATHSSSTSIFPISTTILADVPTTNYGPRINMTHLHLLHCFKSKQSTLRETFAESHQAITRNYHRLAVLAKIRYCIPDGNPILPLHLALLDTMSSAFNPP